MFKHRIYLAEIYADVFAPAKLQVRSAQTRKLYKLAISNLSDFLGRPARVADLTDANVGGMMAWLLDNGRGVVTANNRRGYLLAFWNWLAKHGHLKRWPDVPKLPEPKRTPRAWTAEQLERLLKACGEQQGKIAGIDASAWWTTIHGVWWDTGERTSAVLQIRLADYDPASGELYLPGEIRKTPVDRLYVLTPDTMSVIAKMGHPERTLMFPFPFCLGTFYNHYTRLLKDAGLPSTRRDKPQKMRRSFASHLEAAGGNATEALGHSTRSVTDRSYIDPSIVKKPPPNRLLFKLGGE